MGVISPTINYSSPLARRAFFVSLKGLKRQCSPTESKLHIWIKLPKHFEAVILNLQNYEDYTQ